MKKERLIRLIFVIILMYLILKVGMMTQAKEVTKPEEFRKIRCTFYTDSGTTKDGSQTREGICAMNDYYLGATVVLYRWNADGSIGELIGIYEVKDTGSNKELKEGNRVDLYMNSEERGWDFVSEYGDYVYVQVLWNCVG